MKKADFGLNAKIFYLAIEGLSNRAIARIHSVSEHCVRLRLSRMSKRALVFQAGVLANTKIFEAICFDGLENFAGSQYDPNNIQQALGRDSLFIYDFNFASLNRKGRMSEWQKRRLTEIVSEQGRYNTKAIRLATREIVSRLFERWGRKDSFEFISDEHFQYRRVVNCDLGHLKINHVTISSKACRNFQNILFSVNHADLMIRKQLGAFTRETISFSKTAAAMCQKYALYMIFKNYMAPQFTKKHVRRPHAHLKSPAEVLGLSNRLLHFADIFDVRSRESDLSKLNREWQYYWQGKIPPEQERCLKFKKRAA